MNLSYQSTWLHSFLLFTKDVYIKIYHDAKELLNLFMPKHDDIVSCWNASQLPGQQKNQRPETSFSHCLVGKQKISFSLEMEAVGESGSGGCTAACSYVPGLISFRISGCICMGKSLFAPGLDEASFHWKSHFTSLL